MTEGLMTGVLEIVVALLIVVGSGFALISGLGIVRMPDLFMRMHAATKAGTLGSGFLLIALALDAGELGVTTRALATIVFLLVTAPVAAHVIGRAAYFDGVPLWRGTIGDELGERWDAARSDGDAAPPLQTPAGTDPSGGARSGES